MPQKTAPPSVEISLFAYATEDPAKVLQAAKNLLTEEISNDLTFTRSEMRGYFGNPITVLRSEIRGDLKVIPFLRSLSSRLGEAEKEKLLHEIDRHLDAARNLYLRFDKQAAYLNSIKFSYADPIRIRLKLPHTSGSRTKILEALRNVGLLPT